MTVKQTMIYSMFLLIIGYVSAYDTYINLVYSPVFYEQNPVANYILCASGQNLPLLIAVKFFTTLVCFVVLTGMYFLYPRHAFVVIFFVTFFQLGLLYYLLAY